MTYGPSRHSGRSCRLTQTLITQACRSHGLETLSERPASKLLVPLSLVLLGETGAHGVSGNIVRQLATPEGRLGRRICLGVDT